MCRWRWGIASVVFGLALTAGAVAGQTGQVAAEPAGATETAVVSVQAQVVQETVPVFRAGEDEPALRPNHPPLDQIPPIPMPEPVEQPGTVGLRGTVFYNAITGETITNPVVDIPRWEELRQGGGTPGLGGISDLENPERSFGNMARVTNTNAHPYRMNCKLVMRFEDGGGNDHWFVASGSMMDAEMVMTAGHCVYDQTYGWAKEIWAYPGHNPTDNPYGVGYGTFFASTTAWTNNGNWDGDVGMIEITRAVGTLTNWYGWVYGGDCAFHQGKTYNNASYPAEGCPSAPANWGEDQYIWAGHFDACPSNQLQLNTGGGHCLDTVWGGMSGSGAYYIDGSSRYVHAVCSTSNRYDRGYYCRFEAYWINYMNNTFVPVYCRGTAFDLQPLDCNAAPATIMAGESTTLLNHLAVNATNGSANGTWTFRVYLSTNDNISSADTLLSTQNYAWNFGAMGSVTVNMGMVTIPNNTPSGNYWLGLEYDPATDGDSSNNDTDGWDAVPITVTPRCATPPDYDYTIVPKPAWQVTTQLSFEATGCHVYRVFLNSNKRYDFSLCVNDAVGALCNPGDGDFTLYNSSGTYVWDIDGPSTCGYDATTLPYYAGGWSPPADGYYYLKVSEYYGGAATYKLAYRGVCTAPPDYDFEITPAPGWQTTGDLSFDIGGCHVYKMYLQAGRKYDFSLCVNDGVGADYDSGGGDGDFRMLDAAGAQLWYIDGQSSCGWNASTLGSAWEGWSPPVSGYYYLTISDYYESYAAIYRLAYRRDCQAPATPNTPTPAHGATGVSLNADLMWNALYREDFNDGQAQGWQEDVDADWTVVSDTYRAYEAAPTQTITMVATYGGQTFGNFTYEAKFRRGEALDYARYLLFRATADFEESPLRAGSGYAFGLDESVFLIFKIVSGSLSVLQSWTSSPAINPPTEWNTLKVVASGPVLDFFINGVLVQTIMDTSLTSGRIGLLGYTGPSFANTHYFDEVVVGAAAPSRATISPLQQWYNEHPLIGGTPASAPEAPDDLQPPAELLRDAGRDQPAEDPLVPTALGDVVNVPQSAMWGEATKPADLVPSESSIHEGFVVRDGILMEGTDEETPAVPVVPRESVSAPRAGAVFINFDDVTAPCIFAQTVRLTNQYAALGVVFAGPGGNDGGAILNQCGNFGVTGHSSPNFLAFNAGSQLSDGGIPQDPETLLFDTPVSTVEILVGSNQTGTVTLEAYNAGNTLVDSATVALSTALQPLSVGGIGITHVVISSTADVFVVDDLSFTPSEPGCLPVYDVYFGTTNPPVTLLCDDTPDTVCDPGALAANTTYYWRVIAGNEAGAATGPVWSFTTTPGQPGCAICGPGSHWIHNPGCPAGTDNIASSEALVGIDLNFDCVKDTTLRLLGPVTVNRTVPMDDSVNFPGTRPVDGHLDVIDTEMLQMILLDTAPGSPITLTAGLGLGNGGVLPATQGNIAEWTTDSTLAHSFFDVFFEINMSGGLYLYNHSPLEIASDITCLPPEASYIHPQLCLPLYNAPVGGAHVANLVTADHTPYPELARVIASTPADQKSLWRTAKNTIRLVFDQDITAPTAAQIHIERLVAGGLYGPNLSGSFSYTVENDGGGHPRVLKIRETGASTVLTHQTWIGIRNVGDWSGVEHFKVEYVVMIGDVNNDLKVLATDLSAIFPKIPTANAADQERADVNGDAKVLATDLSAVFPRIPSSTPAKPTGH